jgi:hypothetical protein
MENSKLAFIIIFNHRYDENIGILKKLYGARFSNIYFLVPFYDGEEENVIPVYEHSHYFQGYIAQGFRQFFKSDYTHYFFIGDDLFLNPAINEKNYQEKLLINENTGYISHIENMPNGNWVHNIKGLNYNPYQIGIEISKEIPSAKEAEEKLLKFKIRNGSYTFKQTYFYNGYKNIRNIINQIVTYLYNRKILGSNLKATRYPYAVAYSDIFVVTAKSIKKFSHYCGAFAASNLFVELAVPTALVLAGEQVRTENEISMQGRALWTKEDFAILDKYDFHLNHLINDFPANYLYLHPIKLSKWKWDNF